ncbi:MAG: STAS domain-containing protein [Leptospiraceae bacterium]|nr:STAS domain-containing protein [Leptospiraceae bacterium]MCB1201544.1 STAS domain-containing protein [Leptospiraceae bacterium]
MEVRVNAQPDFTIISAKGSLDMYSSLDLKNRTDSLTIKAGHHVVFDLNEVSYIDSSGIGTLIKIVNTIQEKQAEFFITGLKPMIEKIFKIAGLMNYFTVLTDEEFKAKYPS